MNAPHNITPSPFAPLADPQAPAHCGFTVLIDTREQHPFSFTGIHTDADREYRPLLIPTQWQGLTTGDYSILGLSQSIALERKSREDLYGTITTGGERRDRFIAELERLSAIEFAAIVVEESFGACLRHPPSFGKMDPQHRAKTLARSVLSWQQKYPRVQWMFADDRRLAEMVAYRYLEKFWQRHSKSK